MEECLRKLANHFPAARFVKLGVEDAEMEPAGVPALIAYRGGDKFAALVPILDEIPEDADLSASTLEVLLKRYVPQRKTLQSLTQDIAATTASQNSR